MTLCLHLAVALIFCLQGIFAQTLDGTNTFLGQNGSRQTWGHPVVRRNNSDSTARRRSIVDRGVLLPAGTLVKFMAYIHGGLPECPAQFQIWSVQGENRFRLEFGINTTLPAVAGVHQVEVEPNVSINQGSLLGIAFYLDFNPVSFDLVNNYNTQYLMDTQVVSGRTYNFNLLSYPMVLSMAVEIDTNRSNSTTIVPPTTKTSMPPPTTITTTQTTAQTTTTTTTTTTSRIPSTIGVASSGIRINHHLCFWIFITWFCLAQK